MGIKIPIPSTYTHPPMVFARCPFCGLTCTCTSGCDEEENLLPKKLLANAVPRTTRESFFRKCDERSDQTCFPFSSSFFLLLFFFYFLLSSFLAKLRCELSTLVPWIFGNFRNIESWVIGGLRMRNLNFYERGGRKREMKMYLAFWICTLVWIFLLLLACRVSSFKVFLYVQVFNS